MCVCACACACVFCLCVSLRAPICSSQHMLCTHSCPMMYAHFVPRLLRQSDIPYLLPYSPRCPNFKINNGNPGGHSAQPVPVQVCVYACTCAFVRVHVCWCACACTCMRASLLCASLLCASLCLHMYVCVSCVRHCACTCMCASVVCITVVCVTAPAHVCVRHPPNFIFAKPRSL